MRTVRPIGSAFSAVEEELDNKSAYLQESLEEAYENLTSLVDVTVERLENASEGAAHAASAAVANVTSLADVSSWHKALADVAAQGIRFSGALQGFATMLLMLGLVCGVYGLYIYAQRRGWITAESSSSDTMQGTSSKSKMLAPPAAGSSGKLSSHARPRPKSKEKPPEAHDPQRRPMANPQNAHSDESGSDDGPVREPQWASSADAAAGGAAGGMSMPAVVTASVAAEGESYFGHPSAADEDEPESDDAPETDHPTSLPGLMSQPVNDTGCESEDSEVYDINGGDRRYSQISKQQARKVICQARAEKPGSQ